MVPAPGGAVTDTGVILTAATFFITVTSLMFLAGIGTDDSITLPQNPGSVDATGEDAETGAGTAPENAQSTTFACAISPLFGVFGVYFLCPQVAETIRSIGATVGNVFRFVYNYLGFVFDLVTFNNPEVPPVLTAFILTPLGFIVGFIAYRSLRGVSS